MKSRTITSSVTAGERPETTSRAADDKDYNDVDVQFVQNMIPHHQAAVDMATTVISDGENKEVRGIAENIVEAQTAEIEVLQAWLDDRDVKSTPAKKMKMQRFDRRNIPILTREATVDSVTVAEGAAPEIDITWTTGARVQRVRFEGWDERIEFDEELVVTPEAVRLERLNAGAPFLNSHQAYSLDAVIGTVVEGSVRVAGGRGTARVRLTTAPDAAGVVQRIADRTIHNVSVGYRVHQFQITKKDGERELWRAVDWEPYEISAVAIPADVGAQISSAPSGAARGAPLHTCLFVRQDESAAYEAKPEGTAMNTHQNAMGDAQITPEQESPVTDGSEVVRAERERSAGILALARRHALGDAFAEDLIRTGVSLDAARTRVLDRLAARAPSSGQSEVVSAQAYGGAEMEIGYRDAMSNALMHRDNPGSVTLTADGRQFRGMSVVEMAKDALERRGISTRGMSKMEVAEAALAMRAGGYHTNSDFPNILANVANKSLRTAYDTTPRSFSTWARRATITDFKQVSRNQLGGAPDLLRVNEAGEIKYGTMGEKKEVYALLSYGRIIAVSRQALVNDDLEAFTRIPAAFGAAAADLESDLVYTILSGTVTMADGLALFHASHGNLAAAGAAISETTIGDAFRTFGQQKGIEGRVIRALPKYLIVPPGKRSVEARKIVTQTTPQNVSDVNTFAGRLEVVEEPRLLPASGTIDPWFLAADYNRIDTVEYAYLEGSDGVYTETRNGFERDGMEIKARHDFATKAIDWLGLYKNPGA